MAVSCSPDVELGAEPSPLTGKTWGDAAALYYSDDSSGDVPNRDRDLETADGEPAFSVRSFDVAGTTSIWVSGVWYDASTGVADYVGAVRKFVFGSGFSTEFTHFKPIVDKSLSVLETRLVGGLGTGSDVLALFARDNGSSFQVVPRYYSTGVWSASGDDASTPWTIPLASAARYPATALDRLKERYGYLEASRDSYGRVWLGAFPRTALGSEPDLTRSAYLGVWRVVNGITAISSPLAGDWIQSLPIAHDQTGMGCIGQAKAGNQELKLLCTSDYPNAPALDGSPSVLNYTDTATTQAGGLKLTSDHAGGTLAAWMEKTAADSGVFARVVYEGMLGSSTLYRIDTAIEEGYRPAIGFSGRPTAGMDSVAVAALGQDDFIVVWVGVHATQKLARLFYARHHPTKGWQAPESLTDAVSFVKRLPFASPELFSSGDGVVALAVRTVTAESGLNWVTALAPATRADPVHADEDVSPLDEMKMTVAMYEKSAGWTAPRTVGEGCIPSVGLAHSYLGYCTHPPRGIAQSDGKALILFQDRDNAGRYRLKAITFE